MVECRGGCNGKIVPLVPIPFSINPVQCKGHDCQDICTDSVFRPGGIYFAGGHILNIISVSHIIILCSSICRRTIMYNNIFRHYHPAQHNFTGFIHRLYLILRDFGWIFLVQGMPRYHKYLFIFICRSHSYVLECRHICQKLCT